MNNDTNRSTTLLQTNDLPINNLHESMGQQEQTIAQSISGIDTQPLESEESSPQPLTTTKKIIPELQNVVADTLFIPLYMRAKLTKENSPVIKDDSAVQLLERIEYDFDKYQDATKSLVGCGVRADYFDQLCSQKIKQTMKSNNELIVISIGSGLDDRYARVREEVVKYVDDYEHYDGQQPLSGFVSFYEMDLPEVMRLRAQLLPMKNNQYYLSGSLLDNDWLEKILNNHEFKGESVEFLFLIEGVLMYFQQSQVQDFFARVAALFSKYYRENQRIAGNPTVTFVFDSISKFVVKMSDKHDAIKRTGTGVRFQWAMEDDHQLSDWHGNYHLHSVVNIMDLQIENWDFASKIWRLLPFVRHSSRILVYQLSL